MKISPERGSAPSSSMCLLSMVFDPEHPRMRMYYMGITFLIFYTLFMGPYESAFPQESDEISTTFRTLYTSMVYISDAAFLLDLFVTMRTKVKVTAYVLFHYKLLLAVESFRTFPQTDTV